jgi:hypothetical protein
MKSKTKQKSTRNEKDPTNFVTKTIPITETANAVKRRYLVAALVVAFVANGTFVYKLYFYAKILSVLSLKPDLVDPWNLYHDEAYSKSTFLMVVFLTISYPRGQIGHSKSMCLYSVAAGGIRSLLAASLVGGSRFQLKI